MAALVLVPAFLGLIYWVMLRSPKFSAKRAGASAHSLTGHNVGLYFAIFGLADLVVTMGTNLSELNAVTGSTGKLLGGLLAALVVALVVIPKADFVLVLLGAVATTASEFIEHGEQIGILFLIVVMLALTFFSLIRGLFGRG